ncbi:retrovirus-related Pol polyprotein from transposon opus [Nephila pilipes]|uniref:Retrovirus-related Pol polyprotein from transposon opus n=1 Tax=Nephila pilipes TaxID=299642 RepID=A0A8X6MF85_NEPPI|nr:retrovirus-related Pol polyprotein from transposon opus [Nephila pilipes]
MVSETWYKSITLDVNHKCFDVNFKLDTGAEVNILPLYILNMFKVKPKLSETNLSLTTYGNFKLKPDGSLIINCSTNKLKNVPLPFYVLNVKSKPILGLKGCKELKLIERIDANECSVISKNELIKQYKDVFTGIGEFPSEPYHITLKDNSVPVIHPPRRVPQALQPKLKSTLNNLEKEGIVSSIKPDPEHIKAIVAMSTPKSKTEVRRLLDMVNFLSKFINNVSKVTTPLREIIHENVEFNWGKEQELSFVNIKELLAKAPILKVFSASDEIIIQCVSSKDGLGSCLNQKGQPVSFVSRSLTNSEKNYAQIEKELLAIIFSFEKYHSFVYGRKVTIQSDHKLLMAIVKKPMHKISSRMQRMILKLLKYDFEINYVPGNQMFLADTLSRAFPVNENVRDDPEMLNIVHTVSKHLPMSEKRLAQF